nr:DUF2306 domain-containing protein [uncultured Hyphomonas sp.]
MSDLTQTLRRIHLPGRPGRTTIALIMAAIAYGVISWLILRSAGNPPVHFRINITPLVEAAFVIKLHVLGAVTAFVVGAILLRGVKGAGLHRKLGYTWVAAMGLTAISSFFITGLNGSHFSWIHGISAWTIIALPMAVAAARRRNIRKHAKGMTNAFVGGLLVAGLFTFLPGRMLWSIFFAV